MKIGKYEFKDIKTAESKIKSLGVETDEEGNIVKAEHPYGWKSAAVTVSGQGIHSFYGVDYQKNKM